MLIFSWAKGDDSSKDRLRNLQLDMRLQEVYETYHSFRRLVSDTATEQGRYKLNDEQAPESKVRDFYSSLADRIDLENVHLTGHSFGGGTMVSTPLTSLQTRAILK
jgi:platelet-activating factor acetylhydrolase